MGPFIGLTPGLREILSLMADGLSNEGIAKATGKTRATIRTQASELYDVLGASNRAHAVAIGLREGVIE